MTVVSPVSRSRVSLPDPARPVAMIVAAEPDRVAAIDEELLRKLFGLTRSEATLLRLLVQGVTLANAAERLIWPSKPFARGQNRYSKRRILTDNLS